MKKDYEYYKGLPDLEEYGDEYEDLADFGEEKREKEEQESHLLSWKELREKYKIPSYDELTKGWFSFRYALSVGRLLDIIVGPRSLGKSTNVGLWMIIYFLDHLEDKRNGWIYIRRDKDEVEKSAETWFDNAIDILNQYITDESDKLHMVYSGGRYHLNNKLVGISASLKKQQKLKSKNLSWTKWHVYDEAITQDGMGYIGGSANMEKEYDYLMALATTADRDVGNPACDEVVTVVLANNEGFNNPIYRGCGADKYLTADAHVIKPKDAEWLLQMPRYEDAPEAAKIRESRRMSLQRKDMLAKDYDIVEKKDKDAFIRKDIKGDMDAIANFTWNGIEFCFWANYREGLFVIKRGHAQARSIRNYALTLPDHRPNYFLITSPSKTDVPITIMKDARMKGILYFENEKLMTAVDTFLKFLV